MDTSALKNSTLSFMKSFNFMAVLYISVVSAVTILKIGNSGGGSHVFEKGKRPAAGSGENASYFRKLFCAFDGFDVRA